MSEPATTPTSDAPLDFAAFEAAENAKALGQDPPKADAPAADPEPVDADEAEPVEAAAGEAVAESATPTPTPEKPISKRQQQINDLIRTRTEAEQRAKQLEERLAALEQQKPAAEPPKPEQQAAAPSPVVDPTDPEPTEDQIGTKYATYAEFARELARWVVRQDRRDAQATAERESKERAQRERISTWYERRDTYAATQPDFVTKAGPFLDRVQRNTPLFDVLTDSPVGPAIAYHLATHPEVWSRIAPLGPLQQLRALGAIEAQYDPSLVTSTSASAGPAAKLVTTAPAPPTTLAARSADPADPVAAAVARGDFSAFEAEENRRALAASR